MAKQSRSIEQGASAMDLRSEIESMLMNPIACEANFKNLVSNENESTADLMNALGAMKYDVANPDVLYENGQLRILSWNLVDSGTIIQAAAPAKQIMYLNIFLEKTGSNPQKIVRTIPIWTQKVGAANTAIDKCYAVSGPGSDIWMRSASGTDIYNSNPGNVGIGTTSPGVKLDVNGGARFSGYATINEGISTLMNWIQNDATSQTAASGSLEVGLPVSNGAYRANVFGNTSETSSTITGSLEVQGNSNISGSMSTGSLTVNGHTTLNNMTTLGPAEFQSTSRVVGTGQLQGAVKISGPLYVGGYAPNTNAMGVSGNMNTGSLNSGTLNASEYCIGANCRTSFAPQACPIAGQVVRTINSDGTIQCADPRCSPGFFLRGLNADGTPICSVLPTPTCAVNTYVSNYDAVTGSYTCEPLTPGIQVSTCPVGTILKGVSGMVPTCIPISITGQPNCPAGQSLVQINADGTAVCGASYSSANTCSGSLVVVGVNANGSPVCGNITTNQDCVGPNNVVLRINPDGSRVCSLNAAGGSCPGSTVRGIAADGSVVCNPSSVVTTTTIPSSCAIDGADLNPGGACAAAGYVAGGPATVGGVTCCSGTSHTFCPYIGASTETYCGAPPVTTTTTTLPACGADGDIVHVQYGSCIGGPGMAGLAASCCSGTAYAVCDANSDKFFYCGTTPPAGCNCPPEPAGGGEQRVQCTPNNGTVSGGFCTVNETFLQDIMSGTSGPCEAYPISCPYP